MGLSIAYVFIWSLSVNADNNFSWRNTSLVGCDVSKFLRPQQMINHSVYQCKSMDFEERTVECRNCTTIVQCTGTLLMQICARYSYVKQYHSKFVFLCARASERASFYTFFCYWFFFFPSCCFECSQIRKKKQLNHKTFTLRSNDFVLIQCC